MAKVIAWRKGPTYAVNIGDMTKDTLLWGEIFRDVFPHRIIVHAEGGRVDGGAVVMEVSQDRAEAIVSCCRRVHPQKNLMRIYFSKTGRKGWKRV